MQEMFPQVSDGGEVPPFRVAPLTGVLGSVVDPELWLPRLPGESWLERRARRDAALDMLCDELLAGGVLDAAA